MNDDELGRLLAESFDARARSAIAEQATPPPARFRAPATRPRAHRLAPLLAAAAVVALVAAGAGLLGTRGSHHPVAGAGSSSANPLLRPVSGAPVHIRLLNVDGRQVGVGMPVVAYFSRRITDGRALQAATTVTVNGAAARGAWYFEPSVADPNYPYEAHLRLQDYWPAHASVHVALATDHLSAGRGLAYDDNLTLDFPTGASHIAVVDDNTHRMTVQVDGDRVGSYPVSLGAKATPTSRGTKVILGRITHPCAVTRYPALCGTTGVLQLDDDGEYVVGSGVQAYAVRDGLDVTGGSTALRPADAQALYRLFGVGDLVLYPNADGPRMQLGQGLGDWNVDWQQWLTGGLVRTH